MINYKDHWDPGRIICYTLITLLIAILILWISGASHVKGLIPMWAKHTVVILLFTNMLSWYQVKFTWKIHTKKYFSYFCRSAYFFYLSSLISCTLSLSMQFFLQYSNKQLMKYFICHFYYLLYNSDWHSNA